MRTQLTWTALLLFILTGVPRADGVIGRVTSRLGAPVAGAQVRLSEMKVDAAPCGFHAAIDSTLTDSSGNYAFRSDGYSGFYDVTVTKDGGGERCTFVEAGNPATVLDLELSGPDTLCTIGGVALVKGAPQARASRIRIIVHREYAAIDTLETDSAGVFHLSNLLPASRYSLLVRDEAVEDMAYELFDLKPGNVRSVRMELSPKTVRAGTASLSGRVIDAADSLPLAGVLVRLEEKGRGGMPIRDSARSDREGRFSFTALPAIQGPGFGYHLIAAGEGYRVTATAPISLAEGERKDLVLALGRKVSLRVQAEEAAQSGKFLPGATVVVARPQDKLPFAAEDVDARGQASFPGLAAGTFEVTVARPGFRTKAFRVEIDGRKGEDTLVAPLDRDEPATSRSLRGRVLGPSGHPVMVEAFFTGSMPDGRIALLVRLESDGDYLLTGIPEAVRSGHFHLPGTEPVAVALEAAETWLNVAYDGGPALGVGPRRLPRRESGKILRGRDLLGRADPPFPAASSSGRRAQPPQ